MLADGFQLSRLQCFAKRTFDICGSVAGLLILWPVILVSVIVARWDTHEAGLFIQLRVGRHGRLFQVFKIRTMRQQAGWTTNVTASHDPRITPIGSWFRRTKIDELPQLINVLIGDMSFVGPRPDVPEAFEDLCEDDRIILSVRPGITGPASIKYRNEEQLLAEVPDPERFNREVIFPDKVLMNKTYIAEYRFHKDIVFLLRTVFSRSSLHGGSIHSERRSTRQV